MMIMERIVCDRAAECGRRCLHAQAHHRHGTRCKPRRCPLWRPAGRRQMVECKGDGR